MTAFRYKAFISYSWADAAWGAWLQKAIETYRTPAALVGKDGALGPVPARLHPLFKDREEEAAGASIGAAVETALAASEFLIVVCSPNSAKSQWVNRELAWFKTHRDPAKVLALIVDGSPGSGGENECFPLALTHHIAPDLTITGDPTDHPLAADARDSGDGKRKARLKIAAALLGVGLDELVRRDDRRRALRVRLVVGGSLALALAMSALALAAVRARDEADFQRAESDGLVEFMLTDLRDKLQPVGRLDALDVVGQRALKYYAGQKASKLDADALGRRARALHLVGEVANIRGDSVAALTAFRQAAATTAEQLARDPNNPQRIYDHAQSVFWVGQVANERGEAKEAEAQWSEYKRLADQLVAIDPKKPEWQMEVSYAQTNLGILYFDQARFAEADRAFADALRMVEAVAAGERFDAARQIEVGAALDWLGKARARLNLTRDAIALHRREIGIYQAVLSRDAGNTNALFNQALAWQHIAQLEEIDNHLDVAEAAIGYSIVAFAKLRKLEPGNTDWQENELRAWNSKADILFYRGDLAAANRAQKVAEALLASLMAQDPSNFVWSGELRSLTDLYGGRLALAAGHAQQALALARGIAKRGETASTARSGEMSRMLWAAAILEGDALVQLHDAARARDVWMKAANALVQAGDDQDLRLLRLRYLLARRLGDRAQVQLLQTELDRRGYRHPAYLQARSS